MFLLIALLLSAGAPAVHGHPSASPSGIHPMNIDSLGITAGPGTKWYSYTNKEAGFYFGEVHGPNIYPYQGWTVYNDPVLRDYSISIDGKDLDRLDSKVVVYPDRLVRYYDSGVTESFTLLDEVNSFVVDIKSPKMSKVDFRVLFNSTSAEDFALTGGGTAYVLEDKSLPVGNYGRWVGVGAFSMTRKPDGKIIDGFISPQVFSAKGKSVSFVVTCARTRLDAIRGAFGLLRLREKSEKNRKERMQALLDTSFVTTENPRFDKALAWAKLSLNALVTDQGMRGIWAGLPWFNNYWGRDSFISLPGATLWNGDFKTARQILLDFAAKQDTNKLSHNYGRIPNLITPTETLYNTADGTPWFVFAAYRYLAASGDRDFLFKIYPAIKRAFEGTMKYHVDKHYFLTHGDQETWMDAVGPNGSYTPRGNRAVEVEALWLRQILVTRLFATYTGDIDLKSETTAIAKTLIKNFNEYFVNKKAGLLYDHLDKDGKPDTTLRPNQMFALGPITNQKLSANILRTVVEKLDYPWGVASLYQGDPNFHPYHDDEPYYPPDAAYHNGTVWVWLTGQLVSDLTEANEPDFAFKNTDFLANEILNGKTAGTLPELFDAFPHKGESIPNSSGAFSQAWSLAEFVDGFYNDYLGVQIDAYENTMTIRPRMPEALPNVSFVLNGGNDQRYLITYRFGKIPKEIEITPLDSVPGTTVSVLLMMNKEKQVRTAFYTSGRDSYILKCYPDTVLAEKDGKPFPVDDIVTSPPHSYSLDDLHFETPKTYPDWNFEKLADLKVLTTSVVKRTDSAATVFASDDANTGADKGPNGRYTYPLNGNFQPGILDLTHAEISYDKDNVFFKLKFKNLANPMWHPEYGYQLTFAAIAIGDGKGGQLKVGRNSDYTLPIGRGYEKIIYVGGGIEVFNNEGKKLAAYVPTMADIDSTLGDISKKELTFSLPQSIIGKPSSDWKVSILVGAQDDHGGGGVGDFRTVDREASEWHGGGRIDKNESNIYCKMFLK